MNKKRMLIGIFIAMAIIMCGSLFVKMQPSVFAEEVLQSQNEQVVNEAGTFYAQGSHSVTEDGLGFYVVGDQVTLIAIMNSGYEFDAWVAIAGDNSETILSEKQQCSIIVEGNITIEPRWHKINYEIEFNSDLYNGTELKDFTYKINNKTQQNGSNYYDDEIEIVVNIKSDRYITPLKTINIEINDVSIYDILRGNNNMNVKCDIVNDEGSEAKTGFTSFVITLNIHEKVVIDIEYSYMYKLQVSSSNDIDISELIQFITISGHYSQPDSTKYEYLVVAEEAVVITIQEGNDIYAFEVYEFVGKAPSKVTSQTYRITEDSRFIVTYNKVEYKVSFKTYLTNLYGTSGLIEPSFYNIEDLVVLAGDEISFNYNAENGNIEIINAKGTKIEHAYLFDKYGYGYKFIGFAINNELVQENKVVISATEPKNVEIQLIFEYIKYDLQISLVDEYFLDSAEYALIFDNQINKAVTGSLINVQARTLKYVINGWSWSNNPKVEGYLHTAQNENSDNFSFEFVPISNDNSQPYILYLDVDYKYSSIQYELTPRSINQNVLYDIVSVDTANKTITFSDSELQESVKTVNYLDENVTIEGNLTTIITSEFGKIEIENGILNYISNSIKVSSINKETQQGVDIYTFEKYTYFGELQVGLIENITLSESGSNVRVVLGGKTYATTGQSVGEIQVFDTYKTQLAESNVYAIKYNDYSMKLYMNNGEYDYIELMGVKYVFDGEKFVLVNATINTPEEVDYTPIAGANCGIKLDNLLPNSLLMYYTKSTNVSNYKFISFTNQTGSKLWNFEYNDFKVCLLGVDATNQVNVEYRRLENNIHLVINNENAYNYDNIVFTIASAENSVSGTGNSISSQDGNTITISINADYITKGYKFDNYVFNDAVIEAEENNPLTITFVMDSRVYANQIIYINFSEIVYTININYIDRNGQIIDNPDEVQGLLRLQGQTEAINSLQVVLTKEYIFEAMANQGYYVANAYIGTEAYILEGLKGSNSSEQLKTSWKLSALNFEQAIIDNSVTNEVELYVQFAIHTYSVKVYFDINEDAFKISYPTLYINNVEQRLIIATETEDGVATTKRYVLAQGFEYGSQVSLEAKNFMLGTAIEYWTTMKNEPLTILSNYSIGDIKQDVVLKVLLKHVEYEIQFISVNEEHNECLYGSANSYQKTIKLFEKYYYTTNTEMGYVLKDIYYYDNNGQVGSKDISSGFIFNPADFRIENGTSVKIYLVFGLKIVNLEIGNVVNGSKYCFNSYNVEDLAKHTISRQRGDVITALDPTTGYQFQTGDILIMEIAPISMGIELNRVKLDAINITLLSSKPYTMYTTEVLEDGYVVGLKYNLVIEFAPDVINALKENAQLQNILKVKTFEINYTYNYIDYNFGISLIREYGGSTATGNRDVPLKISNVGFGTNVIFSYGYEGMNSGAGSKFTVDGFKIAKTTYNEQNEFSLEGIIMWEEVARFMYNEQVSDVSVVLMLKPKIVLNNYTDYTEEGGYLYKRQYIGENQGLVTIGGEMDIVIGGDFEAIIQYSYDGGNEFIDKKPIDVGEYQVKIIAKIASSNSQVTDVVFNEKVMFIITPASVTLSLKTYNTENPITKTYDGTNNLSAKIIVDDIQINGLFERDYNGIYIDSSRLRAQFAEVIVNPTSQLYDINIFDIYLLDSSNNIVTNYKLSSGLNLVFRQIGKITPKELRITGFVVSNKVYDNTPDVLTNVEGITYVGKLQSDSTQILTENLKFYLEDYSIGFDREVFIDWSSALVGADSTNYSITYDKVYIDIHPYEVTYSLRDYGTFKIVDEERLCLIPIDSRVFAEVHEKGSSEYRSTYTLIETSMGQGEKLKVCYEIVMQVGSVSQLVPQGLYIYLPKIKKTSKMMQVPDSSTAEKVEHTQNGGYIIVKAEKGEALFGVVINTTYLPLWVIILIVILSLIIVAVVVFIFILIRRKMKQKYKSYEKI